MKRLFFLSIVLLASISGLKAANNQSNTPNNANGVHQSVSSSQSPATLTVMTNKFSGNTGEEFNQNGFAVDYVSLVQSSGNLTIQIHPYPY